MFSNTFAGIDPSSVPAFIGAQIVGAAVGVVLVRYLYPDAASAADHVVVPHATASPAPNTAAILPPRTAATRVSDDRAHRDHHQRRRQLGTDPDRRPRVPRQRRPVRRIPAADRVLRPGPHQGALRRNRTRRPHSSRGRAGTRGPRPGHVPRAAEAADGGDHRASDLTITMGCGGNCPTCPAPPTATGRSTTPRARTTPRCAASSPTSTPESAYLLRSSYQASSCRRRSSGRAEASFLVPPPLLLPSPTAHMTGSR